MQELDEADDGPGIGDMDVPGFLESGKGLVEALAQKDEDGQSDVDAKKALLSTAQILAASCSAVTTHPGCTVFAGIVQSEAGEESEELKAIKEMQMDLQEIKNLNYDILSAVKQNTLEEALNAANDLFEELMRRQHVDKRTWVEEYFKPTYRSLIYDYSSVDGAGLLGDIMGSGEEDLRKRARAALLYQDLTAFRLRYGALTQFHAKTIMKSDDEVCMAENKKNRDMADDLQTARRLGLAKWIAMDKKDLLKYVDTKEEDVSDAKRYAHCMCAHQCGGFLNVFGMHFTQAKSSFRELPLEARATAVPILVESLTSGSTIERRCAASELGGAGSPGGPAPPLSDEQHHHSALDGAPAPGRRDPAAALAAAPALVRALQQDPDEYTRGNAAEALGRLSHEAVAKAAPALASALQHDSSNFVRELAAKALGRFGPAAATVAAAAPALAFAREHDSDTYVREAAAKALGHVRSEQA